VPDRNQDHLRERLENAKRGNVGNVLIKLGRVLKERTLRELGERGLTGIRMSHTAVTAHIDLDGTRVSELANRLGVTAQGAGKLVREMEALGFVERRPDPLDGRARLVCLTERGFAAMFEALDVLEGVERELRSALGDKRVEALHQSAIASVACLERDG
jgi:DNA-binding MarR family transcriptional regulator